MEVLFGLEGSVEDLKRGYATEDERFVCLHCGEVFEKGVIYPDAGVLYEAEKFAKRHVERVHGSALQALLALGKKETGLTDTQSTLLGLFAAGYSDAQIAAQVGGSMSTIRNHRFSLREKERQARAFLAIMELLDGLAPQRKGAAGAPLEFPRKEKQRQAALQELIKKFRPGKRYSEAEINEVLGESYTDYVWVRRLLIEQELLEREADGHAYWVKGASEMDKRQEMKWEYKHSRRPVGVFQIKCLVNGKVFLVSSTNVEGLINSHRFRLKSGGHRNHELQQDWNRYGEEQFAFEVLELVEPETEGLQDLDAEGEEVKLMEEQWLEKLQPYGDRGYHKQK